MAAPCIYYIDGKEFTKEQFLAYVKKSNTTTVKETIDSGIKAIDTKLQTLRDALKDVNSKIDVAAKSDEPYAKPTDKDFGKRYNAQANARQVDDVRRLADRRSNIQSEYNRLTDERARIADTYPIKATPTAPFVTDTNSWTKLGLKVALKEAVAQGADKIAWTTGEQQNDRYDLSKSVDGLEYQPQRDGKYDVFAHKGDNNIFYEKGIDLKRIEDVFGKDIADKISKNEGTKATYDPNKFYKRLEGDGLKVGGKGMKGFYGSPTEGSLGIVGNVAKSLFKQEPKTIKIEIAKKDEYTLGEANYVGGIGVYDGNGDMVSEFDTKAEANKYIIERSGGTQHSIDITPELKASVEGGQPLFKDAEAQYRIESGKNIIEAIKDFNQSKNKARATVALTHEIMHPTVVSIIDGAKEGNEVGARHTKTIVDEYNKANPDNKVTEEELIADNDKFVNGETTDKYRAVQEFIAEQWERYHQEGAKGFSKSFQEVLDAISEAFRSVYKSLTGKELTPELRKMFDEILGKQQPTESTPNVEDWSKDVESTAKALNKTIEFKAEHPKYFEYVPLNEIEKYKEHDRAVEKKWGTSDNTLNELVEDIKKNGIKTPITLQIDRDGRALIVEGNTRLAAAKILGIKNIPVRIVSGEFGSINKDKTKKISIHGRRDISEMEVFYPNIRLLDYDNSAAKFGFNSVQSKGISEAYHKAKADGSNPELVKAVESLLSKEQTPTALRDVESTAKALEGLNENKLSQILTKTVTETQQEYIENQKKEMGSLYSENMIGEFKNEYFSNIEKIIKNGGKISLASYNSLDGGQKYVFDKRYGKSKISSEILYHSTNKEFDSFDLSKAGSATDNGWWGKGIYFFKDKKSANDFSLRNKGSVVKEAKVNLKNPLVLENENLPKNIIEAFNKRGIKAETIWDIQSYALDDMNKNPERITEILMSLDYDGVHLDLFPNKEVLVFNTSSIDKPLNHKNVSEAYHKAKADGSNPELVKAVEELLGKPTEKPKTETTPTVSSEVVSGSALKDVGRTAKAVSKRVAVEHAGYEGAKRVTGANENTLELDGYGTVSTSQFINTLVENGRLPKDALKNRHIQLTDEYATKLLNENSDLFPKENTETNKTEANLPTFESTKKEYDNVKEKHNKYLKKDGGLRANTPDNVKKEIDDAYTKMQSMVKQERDKRVSEDKRDTGLIDGIERIKDNTSAFTLVRMAMNRGVIPERQFNEFGKNLLHIIADAKDSHEVTMQTAEIIQDFSQRANVKVDDLLAREIQAAENLKYEPVEEVKAPTQYTEAATPKKESGGVSGSALKDVEIAAKKIVGESAFEKLKKEGYTIEKGKFDSDAYASFFGLHTGVQANEFANAGLRLVKPSEKIKVYRGKGKNVSEGENEGVTWVAEDKKVAENYSNDGNVEEIEVTKPKNPFPNPTDTIHVKGSDVGNKLKGILNRLFREGKVTKEQAIEASKAIDEFVLAAGEESELYSTKTNKKGVSSKYVKALQALGFDGIVQKESYNSGSPFTATKTGNETNTYGIFKAPTQYTEAATPQKESDGVSGSALKDVVRQESDAEKLNKEAGVDIYVARQDIDTNGGKYTLSQIKENGNTNTFLIEDAKGNEVGKAQLSANGNYLENIRIDEKHRRKGLASKVYDFIELRKGIELEPSPNKQSKEAKALWDKRNLQKSVSNKANGGLLAKALGESMSKTFADFRNKQQVLLELENKYFEQKGLSKEEFNKLSENEKSEIIKDAIKWKNDNPELVKAVEELLGKPKETSPTPNSKGEGTEVKYQIEESRDEPLSSVNPALAEYIRQRMQRLFPSVALFSDKASFESAAKKVSKGVTFSSAYIGAAIKNMVYVDAEKALQHTEIHEYAHIYWDALPADHPLKTALLDKFGGNEEAAIDAIGRAGTIIMENELDIAKSGFFEKWLKKFWAAVKGVFTSKSIEQAFAERLLTNADEVTEENITSGVVKYMKMKSSAKYSELSEKAVKGIEKIIGKKISSLTFPEYYKHISTEIKPNDFKQWKMLSPQKFLEKMYGIVSPVSTLSPSNKAVFMKQYREYLDDYNWAENNVWTRFASGSMTLTVKEIEDLYMEAYKRKSYGTKDAVNFLADLYSKAVMYKNMQQEIKGDTFNKPFAKMSFDMMSGHEITDLSGSEFVSGKYSLLSPDRVKETILQGREKLYREVQRNATIKEDALKNDFDAIWKRVKDLKSDLRKIVDKTGTYFIDRNSSAYKALRGGTAADRALADLLDMHYKYESAYGGLSMEKGKYRVPVARMDFGGLAKKFGFKEGMRRYFAKPSKYDNVIIDVRSLGLSKPLMTLKQARQEMVKGSNAIYPFQMLKLTKKVDALTKEAYKQFNSGRHANGDIVTTEDLSGSRYGVSFVKDDESSEDLKVSMMLYHYANIENESYDLLSPYSMYIQKYLGRKDKPNMLKWVKMLDDDLIKGESPTSNLGVYAKYVQALTNYTHWLQLGFNIAGMPFNAFAGFAQSVREIGFRNTLRGLRRVIGSLTVGGGAGVVNAKAISIMEKLHIVSLSKDLEMSVTSKIGKGISKIAFLPVSFVEYINHAYSFIGAMDDAEWERLKALPVNASAEDYTKAMGGNERIDELHTLTQKINGAYSKYSRRGINKTAEGRALMQFKNWLPDVIFAHLTVSQLNEAGEDLYGEYQSGIATSIKNTVWNKTIIPMFKDKSIAQAKKNWETLSEHEQMQVGKAMRQLVILGGMALWIASLDDRDDKELKRMLRRAMGDVTYIFDVSNMQFLFDNTVPVFGTIKNLLGLVAEVFSTATGNPSVYEKRQGSHMRGDLKLPVMIENQTPVVNKISKLVNEGD